MISNTQIVLGMASMVTTVLGHGYVLDPPARQPGEAMASVCGQQMFNNQNADIYGNIQGELQVTNGQSDYDAAACNVWLCKGFKYEDNTDSVQSFSVGEVVPFTVDIRAPHTGTANVSVVKTSTNSILGDILISWDVYASNSVSIPENQTSFDVTIPDAASECTTAGDCVIQWFWDARSIDQTYEACVDFTVSGSGSGTTSPDPTTVAPTTTAAPTSTTAPSTTATTAPSTTATTAPVATSTPEPEASETETFTLDTFIEWLRSQASGTTTRRAARRHARQLM